MCVVSENFYAFWNMNQWVTNLSLWGLLVACSQFFILSDSLLLPYLSEDGAYSLPPEMCQLYWFILTPSMKECKVEYRCSFLKRNRYWVGASQVALVVKNSPANAGDLGEVVSILDREDPLKKGMETHSSMLAWRLPWTEEAGGLQSVGSQRVGHDWNDSADTHTHTSIE